MLRGSSINEACKRLLTQENTYFFLWIFGNLTPTENNSMNFQCTKDINKNHILEPKCTWTSPHPYGESLRRALEEDSDGLTLNSDDVPEYFCNVNLSLSLSKKTNLQLVV